MESEQRYFLNWWFWHNLICDSIRMLDSEVSSGDDGADDMKMGINEWSRIDKGGKPARRTMK